jgi:hypothetical protein
MSQQDTSFWSGFTVGDAFEGLVGGYVEREKVRAQSGTNAVIAEQNALINRPDSVTQRPNAQPSQPSQPSEVTAGRGQGSGSRVNLPGGLQVDRTALYIAGAVLAAAVVYKVAG